ncbi:MAG: ABC transporter substrate-binding protein [Deltaproteobacteria bacterium]|nr:ABC transporter substrate-binding protein [Deltaproteobacteria bacterium]
MPREIKILSAGAVQPGLSKVIEAFRRETGDRVTVNFATAPAIRQRLSGGQAPDIVIAPPDLLDEMPQTNRSATRVAIGRIGVGVMVRRDAAAMKISTVDEFVHALQQAESIVYNQASTGIYLDQLFDRLGAGAQINAKVTRYADFSAVLDHISHGRGNELGFGATTVILENVGAGIKFVGPLPAEIQNYTSYAATTSPEANICAHELIRYLTGPSAKGLFTRAGIE